MIQMPATRGGRWVRLSVIVVIAILSSCDKKSEGSDASTDTASIMHAIAGGPVALDSSEITDSVILAEAPGSRAYLVTYRFKSPRGSFWRDSSVMNWSAQDSTGWRLIWSSSELMGALPTATLKDFNGDGTADLFWSIDYEDLIGGMVVVRRPGGVTELVPDVKDCLTPEVQTTDHQTLVVAYLSGAFSPDDCAGAPGRACLARFQIAWPQFYRVEGQSLVAFRREPGFYRELSARYRKDAAELQRLVDSKPDTSDGKQLYCPPETAARMRKLADSALSLAK